MSLVELILETYKRDNKWEFTYRASSSGKCARALAYHKLGFIAEPIIPRRLMVFELGNIIEAQLVKALGNKIHSTQKDVSIHLENYSISAHIDGIYEDMIVDFKSTNTKSFSGFAKRGMVDESYRCQMHCYMKGTGLKKALFVWYNKDTSALHETLIEWSDFIWEKVLNRFDKVFKATKDNLPEREYKPNDKGKLQWQCSYCDYTKTCYPEAIKTFDKQSKPSFCTCID